jgi:hypothetical protein
VSASTTHADAPVTQIEVAVYKIPTDAPKADGTIAWDGATMVAVHAHAGDKVGLGYTYAAAAAGRLIEETLAPAVQGGDALAGRAAAVAVGQGVARAARVRLHLSLTGGREASAARAMMILGIVESR